jgi:hypothetical protein
MSQSKQGMRVTWPVISWNNPSTSLLKWPQFWWEDVSEDKGVDVTLTLWPWNRNSLPPCISETNEDFWLIFGGRVYQGTMVCRANVSCRCNLLTLTLWPLKPKFPSGLYLLNEWRFLVDIWWEDVSGDKGVLRERFVSMWPLTLTLWLWNQNYLLLYLLSEWRILVDIWWEDVSGAKVCRANDLCQWDLRSWTCDLQTEITFRSIPGFHTVGGGDLPPTWIWHGGDIPHQLDEFIFGNFFSGFENYFRQLYVEFKASTLEAELSILWCLKLIRGVISTFKKKAFGGLKKNFWRKPYIFLKWFNILIDIWRNDVTCSDFVFQLVHASFSNYVTQLAAFLRSCLNA